MRAQGTSLPAAIRGPLGTVGLALAERLEAWAGQRARRSPQPPVRLTVVFLQWDGPTARAAFAALDERVTRLAGVEATRLIVDNAATETAVARRADGVIILSGDNSAREFSGWQRGIDHARATGEATDVWLLANDRFNTSPYAFLDKLTAGAVRGADALQAVVGRVDYYPGRVESFGIDVSSWVNTAFFLVPDGVLRRVGGPVLLGPEDVDTIMAPVYPSGSSPFRADGPVGPVHGRYLVAFLGHGPDAPHGARWYRRLEPTEATWPEFRGKVTSILNEQIFSGRARAAGIPLVEMGLAGRLGAMGVGNPAVRAALVRLARRPATEPLRLNRVTSRIGLALRAVASTTMARPHAAAQTVGRQ